MKLTIIVFILFPLLILQTRSDMTFSNPAKYPTNLVATITSASNGYVITLSPASSQPFGYIVSDELTVSSTPSHFYVTLICTNTAVDFGIQAWFSSDYVPWNDCLLGDPMPVVYSDRASLEYPSKLKGTKTAKSIQEYRALDK